MQAGGIRSGAGAVAVLDCADRVCVPAAAVWPAIRARGVGPAKAPWMMQASHSQLGVYTGVYIIGPDPWQRVCCHAAAAAALAMGLRVGPRLGGELNHPAARFWAGHLHACLYSFVVMYYSRCCILGWQAEASPTAGLCTCSVYNIMPGACKVMILQALSSALHCSAVLPGSDARSDAPPLSTRCCRAYASCLPL